MRLVFVRHAIAMERDEFQRLSLRRAHLSKNESESPANDELRPLTERGQKKMQQNAKGLKRWIDTPTLIFSSPLTRAVQTADVLHLMWPDIQVAKIVVLKPKSTPEEFLKWIRDRPDSMKPDATLVFVGHEPHLSSLIGWLMTGQPKSLFEFKKGGACVVEFRHGIEKGKGRLVWLATPSMLRRL
jgi:phosphohistidine phosphatase